MHQHIEIRGAMQWINEYMWLEIAENPSIDHSYCLAEQQASYLQLAFGLNARDCLFDRLGNNYLFNIRIANTYFDKYNEPVDIPVHKQTICCNTQARLLEILDCQLTGIHRKIYLESAILFLLHQAQKNSLVFQLGCESCSIVNNKIDLEKAQLARNYILDNLSNNLTIPIIAGAVGTNQCYLKKAFKEVHQQTVFEFIQENRMSKARYLLQHTGNNITDIAIEVGYSSPSSFSQAYKNYYGISPLEQAKANISDR